MKKLYIYRSVDLENVAYYDRVFLYKKDAFNELKKYTKVDFTTDLIIELSLTHDIDTNFFTNAFDNIKHTLQINNVFQDYISFVDKAFIIYKR